MKPQSTSVRPLLIAALAGRRSGALRRLVRMLRAPGAQDPRVCAGIYARNRGLALDLEAARTAMIDSQVRPNDVTDRRLITAMGAVPRETFLPAARRASAYADLMVETGPGRWLIASLTCAMPCACIA